jgi:hypothetical protein
MAESLELKMPDLMWVEVEIAEAESPKWRNCTATCCDKCDTGEGFKWTDAKTGLAVPSDVWACVYLYLCVCVCTCLFIYMYVCMHICILNIHPVLNS